MRPRDSGSVGELAPLEENDVRDRVGTIVQHLGGGMGRPRRDAVAHLLQQLDSVEKDPARRSRLFRPFGTPAAALQRRLTRAMLHFIAAEASNMAGKRVL